MASASADKPTGAIAVEVLDNLPVNKKTQEIGAYLNQRLNNIEEALPTNMKHEGQRLVRRALIYFAAKAELHDCSVPSFIMCVIQAAEIGLALDGRLCHAVAYNCKVSRKGEADRWEKRAQCMPDYKGLVSVAKRSRQIADCDGDIVCANDHFKYGMFNGSNVFEFTPNLEDRGTIRGAFARVVQPNGLWSVEYMNMAQLNHIRDKSKAKDFGPWKSDTEQMYVKTAIRRLLKMYCDDPTFIHATEIDDASDIIDGQIVTSNNSRARVRMSDFNHRLADAPQAVLTAETPKPTQHPSTPRSDRRKQESESEKPANIDADEPEEPPTLRQEFAACESLKQAAALRDRVCGPDAQSTDEEREHAEELFAEWKKLNS